MAPAVELVYAPGNTPPVSVEDWAFKGHLTVSQHQALTEFRQTLEGLENTKNNLATKDDLTLLRFLRARQFDVKKSMKMVMDDLAWREEIAGKRLSQENFPNMIGFVKNRLVRMAGTDKQGRPILVLRAGEMFPRKVSDIMEVCNFFIFYAENLKKHVESLGFSEFVAIADMKGWSLSDNFSLPVSQLLAQMLQDHFPETLRYAFVVNNPFAFSAAWSLISPFLEDRVKAKVHVYGKKLDRLKEYILSENLEQEFGGTRPTNYDCPDMFVSPLLEGKVCIVAKSPHDAIMWEDETTTTSSKKEESALLSPLKVDEDEDNNGNLAGDFEDIPSSPTNTSAPPPPAAAAGGKLEKKKSMRRTLARMFSVKSKEVSSSSSPPPTAAAAAVVLSTSPKASSSSVADVAVAITTTTSQVEEPQRPLEVIPPKERLRIAVFGGTGKTGKRLILSLLDQYNCDVSAFVRIRGTNLAPELVQRSESGNRLNIVVGEFSSLLDLERVVENCDGVICAIGVQLPSLMALSAGSTMTTSAGAEFLPLAMEKILEAMHKFSSTGNGPQRLVLVSNANASQSWWEAGAGWLANLSKPLYWKNHYQYVADMENKVLASKFKFTIVRPGTLLEEEGEGGGCRVEEGFVFPDTGPGEISRPALCKFLISEVLDVDGKSKHCGKGVAIGKM